MALTFIDETPLTAGQTGIERYSVAVTGGVQYVTVIRSPNGQVLGVASNFVATASGASLPFAVLTALNATVGTLAANLITGAAFVTMISTNATPGAQTTRTATQMFADIPGAGIGFSYMLRICNSGAGTLTLTAGSGVTVTGTATVAQNTFRDFEVTFPSATTCTITNVGLGTYT